MDTLDLRPSLLWCCKCVFLTLKYIFSYIWYIEVDLKIYFIKRQSYKMYFADIENIFSPL